jgi:hypothetical protein
MINIGVNFHAVNGENPDFLKTWTAYWNSTNQKSNIITPGIANLKSDCKAECIPVANQIRFIRQGVSGLVLPLGKAYPKFYSVYILAIAR